MAHIGRLLGRSQSYEQKAGLSRPYWKAQNVQGWCKLRIMHASRVDSGTRQGHKQAENEYVIQLFIVVSSSCLSAVVSARLNRANFLLLEIDAYRCTLAVLWNHRLP